ncbi:IS3 family transposase [Bacillus sp. DX4.1]|uniref:IS3 family transposase n=1 Tax=Bacillus sp. DX4.1 TaxID=3055867 RepID=UPI0025A0CFC7|nr:IS3 family transposase [Bacillus sp. DX4.1]MDM5185969.1 IS3 family transposase [Bacillus sp. DX4.1]MDM5186031.1 IS3 family transposase [Bacillus sp. DX4.1]MDM5186134.1 IS3 family transposase [Bacillus sp. DX4.1]MDM5186243.1 IS3 family transposase [Bacillus sp. DX4.1]MDM5188380.1 IS3 family transposase [Bacillus sp. DX4.1]
MLKKALSCEKGDEVKRDKSIEYEIIHTLKHSFPIVFLCEIAGVSRSGYYKWEKRRTNPSEKMKEDQFIMSKIVECELDPDINGSFGYPRVCTWLKKYCGLQINHKRVYRLMKKMGIQAKIRKKKWRHFGLKEQCVVSKNRLNREFSASKPNEKWVTDITYLTFNGKRMYLSVIMDLYNNEIVAYQVSESNNLKLVIDTVNKALRKRNVHGTVLHSDQGYQYTSKKYNLLLKKYKMNVSMSRKGNCYDNACVESFFSHFKTECFYRNEFHEKEQVFKAIRRYMRYYNNKRFQKKLNNLSPAEFGTKAA